MNYNIDWSASDNSEDEKDVNNLGANNKGRCTFCSILLKSQAEVERHEKDECTVAKDCSVNRVICKTGTAKFVCDICYKTFKYLRSLVEHAKRHQPPGGFVCKYCDLKFCTALQLDKHTEDDHKVYRCLICKEIFQTTENYITHVQNIHYGQQKEYKACENCGRQFYDQKILKFHLETNCGADKKFKCEECGKGFINKYILKAHMDIHIGKREFFCSYCGEGFLKKGSLQVHERKHTGEKPYKCSVCSKTFAHRQSLVTHSSLHTGIKPYFCECCGSQFSCTGNLIAHRKKRPDTCGQPQYCTKLAKICPRPSIYNPAHLTSVEPIKIAKSHKVLKADEQKLNEESQNKRTKKSQSEFKGKKKKKLTENKSDEKLSPKKIKTEELEVVVNNITPNDQRVSDDVKICIKEEPVIEEKDSNEEKDINEEKDSNDEKNTDNNFDTEVEYDEDFSLALKFVKTEIRNDDIEFNFGEELSQHMRKEKKVNSLKHNLDNGTKNENELKITDKQKFNSKRKRKKIKINLSESGFDDSDDEILATKIKSKSKRSYTIELSKDYIKCCDCNKKFVHNYSYSIHLRRFHKKNKEEIQNLLQIAKDISPTLNCHICKKKYTNGFALEKHVKLHGPKGNLVHRCRACCKLFATINDVKVHMIESHKDKLTCRYCNKTFQSADYVNYHIRYAHHGEEKIQKVFKQKYSFICNKCGKVLSSKSLLTNHEASDCGKSPVHVCNVCGKGYTTAGILKSHMLLHTGELSHNCTFCGKGFRNKYQRNEHERVHTGEKPFQCTFCDQAFSHRTNLFIHLSTHTGIKRYMCSGCGDRFSCISGLKAHWRTHNATCGADPNKSTKPVGEYMGFRKGQVVHEKEVFLG